MRQKELLTASIVEGGKMGGTKKLSKFIVDWENGTRVACNNGAIEREMCINFALMYLRDG